MDGFITDNGILYSCDATGDVCIPHGVRVIAGHVFSHPEKIGSITLPDTVTELEEHAFEGCAMCRV